jgi:hypothetical protein
MYVDATGAAAEGICLALEKYGMTYLTTPLSFQSVRSET